MKAHTDAILSAMTAAGLFQTVTGEEPYELTEAQYPAFVLGGEGNATLKPINEGGTFYRESWQYSGHIVVRSGRGNPDADAERETYAAAVIRALIGAGFRVTARSQVAASYAEDEVLIESLSIEKARTTTY